LQTLYLREKGGPRRTLHWKKKKEGNLFRKKLMKNGRTLVHSLRGEVQKKKE